MRGSIIVLALALASTSNMCGLAEPNVTSRTVESTSSLSSSKPATQTYASSVAAKVDFATHVRPILQSRCQPCHFQGGAVYQKLPFDRPQTIKTLGEKLFTRIKDENDRRVIRGFLAQ
jgi:uncharacterized membrane protein